MVRNMLIRRLGFTLISWIVMVLEVRVNPFDYSNLVRFLLPIMSFIVATVGVLYGSYGGWMGSSDGYLLIP